MGIFVHILSSRVNILDNNFLEVLIEYTDNEKNIYIGDDMSNNNEFLNTIQSRSIPEWFEKNINRNNWNGLIDELYKYVHMKSIPIKFELWTSKENYKIFNDCINKYCINIDSVTIISPNEIARNNLKIAKQYENQGDIKNTLRYYYASATYGNSLDAQLWLGKYYLGEKDYKKSFEWLKKSADQNNIEAEYLLGDFYYYGYIITRDYQKAFYYYKESANKGNNKAQYMLGNCYYNGYGTDKNYNKAFFYYKESAYRGNRKAKYMVGKCYYNGFGCNVDYNMAFEYLNDFSTNEALEMLFRLGVSFYNEKNYDKAFRCLYKSRNISDESQYLLGECYYYGFGCNVDYDMAFKYLNDCNIDDALEMLFRLGVSFYNKKNYDKAFRCLYKSRNISDESQYLLGECYYYGYGTDQYYKNACYYYEKSAKQGNDKAQYMIGHCYYLGRGIAEDETKAIEWLEKSANQGNQNAKKLIEDINQFEKENPNIDIDEELLKRIRKAKKIIMVHVSLAIATGAIPIPFSDFFLLIAIQVAMISEITAVFNIKVSKSVLSALVSSALGGTGATIVGKTIFTNLLNLIPGAGSVAGGAISSTVAGALTLAMGMAYLALMKEVYLGHLKAEDLKTNKAKKIFKEKFKENFKKELSKNNKE